MNEHRMGKLMVKISLIVLAFVMLLILLGGNRDTNKRHQATAKDSSSAVVLVGEQFDTASDNLPEVLYMVQYGDTLYVGYDSNTLLIYTYDTVCK